MENNYLVHSSKGTTWGKHKYVRIENGRYIYPEDLEKRQRDSDATIQRINTQHKINKMARKLNDYAEKYEQARKNVNQTVYNTKSGIRRDVNNAVDTANQKYNDAKYHAIYKKNQAIDAINDYKHEQQVKKNTKNAQRAIDVVSTIGKGLSTAGKAQRDVNNAYDKAVETKNETINYTKHTVSDLNKKQKRKVNRGFQYVARKISNMGNKYEYGN